MTHPHHYALLIMLCIGIALVVKPITKADWDKTADEREGDALLTFVGAILIIAVILTVIVEALL